MLARAVLAAALSLVAAGLAAPAAGQEDRPESVVLVLDASGSMLEPDGRGSTRIAAAKAALRQVISDLPADTNVGLRFYGHRVPSTQKAQACQDTEAVVPVGPLDRDRLTAQVDTVQARGETPIGLSLQEAARDLPTGTDGAVVLISDGRDECFPDLGPDPCAVARELAAGGVRLRIETVGLQVDNQAREQLRCIAEATGGSYVDVADVADLAEELTAASVRARRSFAVRGEPVEGGPSQIDATLLPGPGTYSDTALTGEELWYQLEAPLDQTVRARLTFDGSQNDSAFGVVELQWRGQDGSQLVREFSVNSGRDVVTLAADLPAEDAGSSTRFLRVEVDQYAEDVEYPMVLQVELLGGVEPTASPSAAATAEPLTAQQAQAPAEDGGLPTPAALGIGGLVGLALGAAGTAAVMRRRATTG